MLHTTKITNSEEHTIRLNEDDYKTWLVVKATVNTFLNEHKRRNKFESTPVVLLMSEKGYKLFYAKIKILISKNTNDHACLQFFTQLRNNINAHNTALYQNNYIKIIKASMAQKIECIPGEQQTLAAQRIANSEQRVARSLGARIMLALFSCSRSQNTSEAQPENDIDLPIKKID